MSKSQTQSMACACGVNKLSIQGQPLLRAVCHCHFCQDFNQADYGDIVIYKKDQVTFIDDPKITYRSYKKPPIVSRGNCSECGSPVLEHLNIPLFPRLVFIPANLYAIQESLPRPSLHIFYHRRVKDITDQAPKFSGYLQSEVKLMKEVTSALLTRRS